MATQFADLASAPGGCRFVPIDVCGADGAAAPHLADASLLPPTAVEVAALPAAHAAPAPAAPFLPEGFAPAIDHPPRHSR